MSRERLYLFDTTLRDGAQTNGVDFTVHDKKLIASMLDDLGVDYVEGGYPGAHPSDTEFFATDPKLAVVLELAERKVVVTPESPAAFLSQLQLACPSVRITPTVSGGDA